jgi:hypothetical protein
MIIHETRWKCDYCGAVSPVIEEGFWGPNGWLDMYRVRESNIYAMREEYHFCCSEHLTRHEKKTGISLDPIDHSHPLPSESVQS